MTSYCSIVWEGPVVSNLLDPDYWVTVWNKLIDPGFWVAVWSKLINPDFWLTAWKTFSAPEVAIPLILLLIALYLGVKIKGAIEARKIKGMRAQMAVANERSLLANEQRTAGAAVEREVETLRKQVADLKTRFETGAQHNDLATSVGAADDGEAVLRQRRTTALLHQKWEWAKITTQNAVECESTTTIMATTHERAATSRKHDATR
jgi:hypothetical protein